MKLQKRLVIENRFGKFYGEFVDVEKFTESYQAIEDFLNKKHQLFYCMKTDINYEGEFKEYHFPRDIIKESLITVEVSFI